MKGSKIIKLFEDKVKQNAPGAMDKIQVLAVNAQMRIHDLHARAIGCHCECLGMNAENSWAVCSNTSPPYSAEHYKEAMQKWGLVDEKGEPII